ncbi:lipocalin family protein [Hydrogenophaga sp.]|uniref:lipocalin family protein n=1 Tax=Hydrogenophaga sp. TaxID=1904254 RepID=UPI0025C6A4FC|nr:lipocalin family protein [Hydrogenophaga sp.]MBT9463024.1 lipocalin family protein [Hydrogenophaga sp.]
MTESSSREIRVSDKATPPLTERGLSELDQQILDVEHRLIAREEGLHRRMVSLRQRAEVESRRLVGPASVGLAALVGLFWMMRSRRRSTPVQARTASSKPGSSWMRYVGLALPLLPAQWRSRIHPTAALAVAGLLAPALERVVGGRQVLPPLTTAPMVDLDRYAGVWYEVARLPAPFEGACKGQPTAEYRRRRGEAPGRLRMDVVNRCTDRSGRVRQARGVAVPMLGGGGARLKVSLWPAWLRWLPLAWADYWILHVDGDYTEALVGEPGRRFMWVLSRQPTMPQDRLQALLAQAHQQGFDITRAIYPQR